MTSNREHISEDAAGARGFELDARPVDVLVIGSQLAHGSVGLNAALPVYAEAGLRVAAVPTTILSVLPHYPAMHRVDLDAAWLADTLDDLVACGALDHVRLVVVGYLATREQAGAIARWYRGWRAERGALLPAVDLVLDPTLGDLELGFYNDPILVPALRQELAPIATGMVPNVFELAHLTGHSVAEMTGAALIAAAESLLGEHSSWVAVTGIRDELGRYGQPGRIGELVVTHEGSWTRWHPYLPSRAKGVGDVFAAALASNLVAARNLAESLDDAAAVAARYLAGGESAQ